MRAVLKNKKNEKAKAILTHVTNPGNATVNKKKKKGILTPLTSPENPAGAGEKEIKTENLKQSENIIIKSDEKSPNKQETGNDGKSADLEDGNMAIHVFLYYRYS